MQCPFLFRKGKAHYCEVLEDNYGDRRELLYSWICKMVWESHCLYYENVMNEAGTTDQTVVDTPTILNAVRIGHINRIGGCRALLPDLM
jgi:hypothetical protein